MNIYSALCTSDIIDDESERSDSCLASKVVTRKHKLSSLHIQ